MLTCVCNFRHLELLLAHPKHKQTHHSRGLTVLGFKLTCSCAAANSSVQQSLCTPSIGCKQLLRAVYISRSLAHCWCVYVRCVASRELLKHHQKCQSPSCSICVPVKQHVQQQRLAAQRKMQTQHQQEMLARQRHQLQHERMHTQSQLTAESSMQVGLHTACCCPDTGVIDWRFVHSRYRTTVCQRKPAFACSCSNEYDSRECQPHAMMPGGYHQC